MEEWNFSPNEKLSAGARYTVRGVLNQITANLKRMDEGDESNKAIISFALGDPSSHPCFSTTPAAVEAVVSAVRSSNFNTYTPAVGILSARMAIAEHLSKDLPYKLSADDIFLTVGCTQAIEAILSIFARPSANILLPKPVYPFYKACAAVCGLEWRDYDLNPSNNWDIDLDSVQSVADENTIAMVVINPGNPCGNVFSHQHLEKVAYTAKKLGILVVADEVYRHLTFGTNPFVPMGTFGSIVPVITLGSLSKRWVIPGWRIGWIAMNDPQGIAKEIKVVDCIKNFLYVSADPVTFLQGAIPQILADTGEDFHNRITGTLRQTAELLCERLKEIDCITCPHKPEGAMCAMVKLEISLMEDIVDDVDFCCKLAREESLVILPGIAVGFKNWIRIVFAVEPSILNEGLGRLKSFCQRHQRKL